MITQWIILIWLLSTTSIHAGFLIPKIEPAPENLDPRNPFSTQKPTTGIQTAPCNTIFSCRECLSNSGCGWCDSNIGAPSCQNTYERDGVCGRTGDAWIGSDPPLQMCPNRLFRGTSTTLKHETPGKEGGFGTDSTKGRYKIDRKLYFGTFKKPILLLGGGDKKYERKKVPEEVLEMLKNKDTYISSNGKQLPK